jgi:hypothetical protein
MVANKKKAIVAKKNFFQIDKGEFDFIMPSKNPRR